MASKNNAGPNLIRRLIAVPANNDAGGPVSILATGPTRGFRIRESAVTIANAAQASQGFEVKIPNDGSAAGFTTWFARPAFSASIAPSEQEFSNYNDASQHGAHGEVFGGAGNPDAASIGATTATLLAKVQSLTATATTIEIVEYF